MEKKDYPRVSALLNWYEEKYLEVTYSEFHQKCREAKAVLGTNVHRGIYHFEKDDLFPILDEKEQPYFDSYLMWKEMASPRYLVHEERYYNDEWMVQGQVDGIFLDKWSPYPALMDFKTSVKEGKLWILQAHFYRKICGINLSNMVFLRLNPKGKLPIVHTYNYNPEIEAQCERIAREWHEQFALNSWI